MKKADSSLLHEKHCVSPTFQTDIVSSLPKPAAHLELIYRVSAMMMGWAARLALFLLFRVLKTGSGSHRGKARHPADVQATPALTISERISGNSQGSGEVRSCGSGLSVRLSSTHG